MRTMILSLILLIAQAATAAPPPAQERLTFNIYYTGIYAGTAVQELHRDGDVLRATSTAHSADWLTWLFKVDDRIESISRIEHDRWCPVTYREQIHEGPTRRDKKITFHSNLTATVEDFRGRWSKTVSVTDATFDSLSCFAYTRTRQLEPGMQFAIDIYDGKELHPAVVTVLRRETIRTKAGEFRTVVVRPQLKTGGIFDKKGELHIWMTDDDRHLPVKMVSKVRIGSVTAELARIE